ncbi:DNA replication/repair protein RecF [Lysinimonas soli]|uniref:DNA replication and repair protein RecF n=1 Tax=Lysinimonas soli TaxID=1074233 RepID=A0ABW0NQN2_9MICO
MIVSHLSLTDFRNYESAEVELSAGPNLFVGSNGQGKTNLVESIGYLSTLGSHRVSSDQALIRHGAERAIVRARLEHGDRQLLVEVQLNRSSANRAQVNRVAVKPRELPRYVTSVLFAPEDLALVRGEPSTRRRFLDLLLVQLSPRFAGVIADYERVLRQRNTLLKTARGARITDGRLSTLDLWDERLVDLGSEIIEGRQQLVERLRPHVTEAYQRIAGASHRAELALQLSILGAQPDDDAMGDDDAGVAMLSTGEIVEGFRTGLARVRRAELDRGLTLVGPHRDDLLLVLNGLPARGYASHGESWSFALALKLASAAVLRADSALGDPIVILDDVFAELDEARRQQLAAAIGDYEQVLITAAVFGDVPAPLAAHTVRIRAGMIVEDDHPISGGTSAIEPGEVP